MPKELYQPLGGNEMPRFSGPGTFMRLPSKPSAEGLDACFVGIGLDIGTSNRSGARYGPRQIRAESSFIRPYNMGTRAAPFDSLSVADIGDVAINTFHLPKTVDIIERAYDEILQYDVRPITLGGDHTQGSYITQAHAPGLSTADVLYYRDVYQGAPHKLAEPLRETDFSGLAPAFLVASGIDPLHDDCFAYAERLKAAGVAAEVRDEPLLVHAFLRARHMSRPAAESFTAIIRALRDFARR